MTFNCLLCCKKIRSRTLQRFYRRDDEQTSHVRVSLRGNSGIKSEKKIATHFQLIFTIFQRENLQDNGNMSNFAYEFLKRLSHKDIKLKEKLFLG